MNALPPAADGLEFRPATPADVEPWAALMTRIADAADAPWHEGAADLAEVFGTAVYDPALDTLLGVDGGGVPRAHARVSKAPDADAAYVTGGVDPAWQRRGVGSAVLAWQVARVRERSTGSARARARTFENEAASQALLRGAGFSIARYFDEMVRPLDSLPAVSVPSGVSIVPLTADLHEAVRLAHNEAFADHWGADPRDARRWGFLLGHDDFRPGWSGVAVDDATGEVAGYQLAMYDATIMEREGRARGYTELLGVRRPWRGRGVAAALLADAMARFRAAGMVGAALDVDSENPTGAVGLYEHMGYRLLRRSMAWDLVLD
ncbi:GNAT family N-acetyltransferase [Specibacter cremeus]|uniref:GNAT family N-acetyltransferase n=1 Tax=Specibacter cremeus TaxID=1629051 RepID=UPI000F793470|nr:GNAT family N-acetyltransferase [Specibacter cremeus]